MRNKRDLNRLGAERIVIVLDRTSNSSQSIGQRRVKNCLKPTKRLKAYLARPTLLIDFKTSVLPLSSNLFESHRDYMVDNLLDFPAIYIEVNQETMASVFSLRNQTGVILRRGVGTIRNGEFTQVRKPDRRRI